MTRVAPVLLAALVALASCGGDDVSDGADSKTVVLTFDGSACHFEGPIRLEAGTVDFLFTNESSEPFAAAAISVPELALADVLREQAVGTDWDIPTGHPRHPVDWHNRWPLVPPGQSAAYSWTLPAGTYLIDCVLELDHVWRIARLDVGTDAGEAMPAVESASASS